MAELAGVTVAPSLPNPPWVRWDHTDSGVWPAIGFLDNRDQSAVMRSGPKQPNAFAGRMPSTSMQAGVAGDPDRLVNQEMPMPWAGRRPRGW